VLAEDGFDVEILPVDNSGVVMIEAAEQIIDANTLVVSVHAANNETGVIQPVTEIAAIAHSVGAACHCDAAQAIGKMPVNIVQLGVDLASFSAHKAYGPKGVGVLFASLGRARPVLRAQVWGGDQEGQLRAGTHNVPGIVGFGAACRLVSTQLIGDTMRISRLREICESAILQAVPRARINAKDAARLPGTISVTVPDVPADMLMANLPTLCIGDGAACRAGVPEPSHVLLAMDLSRAEAECTVRISMGRYTTEADVETAVKELRYAVQHLDGVRAAHCWAQ